MLSTGRIVKTGGKELALELEARGYAEYQEERRAGDERAKSTVIKTAAETALAQAFAQARARLPGDGAIAAQRAAAFDLFAKEGLPHRRVEEWKYTDLRALMRDAKPLASAARRRRQGARRRRPAPSSATSKRRRLVFVDGAFVPELSDIAALEPGLTIGSLADALSDGDPTLAAHLGKLAPAGDVAVALNTALMGDGAVIRIAAGATIERPLHLLFVASAKPAATFVRSLVVVEQGARAMLIESHEGPAGSDYQVNAALEIVRRRRGPCRSRQDHRRGRRRAARLDAGGRDRRAGRASTLSPSPPAARWCATSCS